MTDIFPTPRCGGDVPILYGGIWSTDFSIYGPYLFVHIISFDTFTDEIISLIHLLTISFLLNTFTDHIISFDTFTDHIIMLGR